MATMVISARKPARHEAGAMIENFQPLFEKKDRVGSEIVPKYENVGHGNHGASRLERDIVHPF
jgi:hypothetical protein